MPEKAWAYYSSAADDEITNRENHAAFHRYADKCPLFSFTEIILAEYGSVLASLGTLLWLTGQQQYWDINRACLYISYECFFNCVHGVF
jgi:hypothetical protein